MSEVFINNLTIENFGPFYGTTTFNFETLEDRCGVLIGGKNGAGKTHLLRAIYLAVVGETGVHDLSSIEKSGSETSKFRFEESLNRKAAAEGQNTSQFEIEIVLRDRSGGGARKLTLVRNITHRSNSTKWDSIAIDHEGSQEVDDVIIQRIRDSLLPRHLARFFFFDAERSQGLNLGDKEIIDGVSRILGLWTYEELTHDLRNLIQNKIPKQFNSRLLADEERKLSDLSSEVSRIQGHHKSEREKELEIEYELKEMESDLASIEDELRILGVIDPEELDKKRQRREELKESKDKLEAVLYTSWEMALPIALLGDYRLELHDYLLREEKRNEWERSKETVEPKIPQVKKDVFENVVDEYRLGDKQYTYFADRLDFALRRIFHPPPEGMSESVFVLDRVDTSAQVRQKIMQGGTLSTLAERTMAIEKLTLELREIDSWIKQSQQDSHAIARSGELNERAKNLRKQQDDLYAKLKDSKTEQARLESKLKELKREEENQRKIVEKAQKGRSLSTLAARYRETVEEVQKRAAIQLRHSIGDLVGDLWLDISDRSNEFSGMEFDNHWKCNLIQKNGNKVGWENTNASAGQRQVRVLAFYEALRRLARLVPPLVVDTPLGRLDKEVRTAVMEKLYLSGHQSIILATNSEIDPEGDLYQRINNQLARVYTLEPHGDQDSPYYEVSLKPDYFGKRL
jgi:DNA sulfur modification protein DndD